MWFPKAAREWFDISLSTITAQREELAAVKAERDCLQKELTSTQITCDWLRLQLNQLQAERRALLEKAYNITLPTPQLVRHSDLPTPELKDFSFEDVGEAAARALGLPSYEN
jgi:hypothetical protein